MTILIDADGCPVVDIAVKIAVKHKIDCISFAILPTFLRKLERKQSPFPKEATA